MKITKRFSPFLAGALLLGATTIILSGCAAKQAAQPPPDSPRDPITVIAVVTYDGTKASMKTSQGLPDKLIQLSKKYKDTVEWVSPDGLVYVDGWKPESPFDGEPKHDKKVLKSGPPNKKGKFSYNVWLVLTSDPNSRVSVDPRIEVME